MICGYFAGYNNSCVNDLSVYVCCYFWCQEQERNEKPGGVGRSRGRYVILAPLHIGDEYTLGGVT